MINHVTEEVYIKFGKYHGFKGVIDNIKMIDDVAYYVIKLNNGEVITKKQKNTIRIKG